MLRRLLSAALLTLCLAPAARAVDAPESVTRRVNELTFAVVRIDLAANDPQRWMKWSVDLMNKTDLPADMKKAMNKNAAGPTDADHAFADLKAAGVKQAWIVVALGSRNAPIDAALILPDVDDHEALKKTMAGAPLRYDIDGKTVVITQRPEFLDGFVAAPRPELFKPIAAALAGQTVVSVIVPDDLRNLLKTFLPVFPKELGGGPTTVLANGVREVVIAVDAPPAFAIKTEIKAKDAEAATKLATFIDQLKDSARQTASDGKFNVLLDELRPNVAGEKLTIGIDNARALAKAVVPALVQARKAAGAQNPSR